MGIVQFTPFGRGRTSDADKHVQVPYDVLRDLVSAEAPEAGESEVVSFCGWESGNLREVSCTSIVPVTGSIQASDAQAYTGTYSLHLDFLADANPPAITIFAPSTATGHVIGGFGSNDVYFSCRLYIVSVPGTSEMLITYWQAATGMSIRLTSDAELHVYNENDDLIGESSVLSLDEWHLIECKQIYSTDDWELRIDGESVLSGTDTWLEADVSSIILGKHANKHDGGYEVYFDDVVVTTGDYIQQPARVFALQVDADGTHTDWNGTYEDVDEIPAVETLPTDEMEGTAEDQKSSVTCKNFSTLEVSGDIISVRTNLLIRERYNGEGIKIFIRYDGADVLMDEFSNMTVAYNNAFSQLMNTIPGGSDSWDADAVDALEFGAQYVTVIVGGRGPYWGSGQIHILLVEAEELEGGQVDEDNLHPSADVHETFFSWDSHNHEDGSLAIDSIGHKQLTTEKEDAEHCMMLQTQSPKTLVLFGTYQFVFSLENGNTTTQRVDFASTTYAGQSFISGTFPKVLFSRRYLDNDPERYDAILLLSGISSSGFYITGTFLGDAPSAGLTVICTYIATGSAPGVLLHPEE